MVTSARLKVQAGKNPVRERDRGRRIQTGEGVRKRVGEAARRAGEYVSETTDKVSETTLAGLEVTC